MARRYMNDWTRNDAMEMMQGRRPVVVTFVDFASTYHFLARFDYWLCSRYPGSPLYLAGVIRSTVLALIGIGYAGFGCLICTYDAFTASLAELYNMCPTIGLICILYFTPGILLYLASLRWATARDAVAQVSPELKKCYFYLAIAIAIIMGIYECIASLVSQLAWEPAGNDNCDGWINGPSCWFSTGHLKWTDQPQGVPRPSDGAAATGKAFMSSGTKLFEAATNPKESAQSVFQESARHINAAMDTIRQMSEGAHLVLDVLLDRNRLLEIEQ